MASPTRWTWVWVNSGSWWWTERPGMLRSTGSQRVGHDWATELNWTGHRTWEVWSLLGSPFPDPPHHPRSQTLVPATLLERRLAVAFSFFLLFNVYLFICLLWVLVAAHGILPCFSTVVVRRLQKTQTQELPTGHSRPGVCRIFPGQGWNAVVEGRFLTTRPPGKSLLPFFS